MLRVLRSLSPGDVVTYGQVAEEAGFPGAARAVGNILRSRADLPWWRVVGAGGRLVSPSAADQAERLRGEGVRVEGRRVVGHERR